MANEKWNPPETKPNSDIFIGLCSLFTCGNENETIVTVCRYNLYLNEQDMEFYEFDDDFEEKLLGWQPLPPPPQN